MRWHRGQVVLCNIGNMYVLTFLNQVCVHSLKMVISTVWNNWGCSLKEDTIVLSPHTVRREGRRIQFKIKDHRHPCQQTIWNVCQGKLFFQIITCMKFHFSSIQMYEGELCPFCSVWWRVYDILVLLFLNEVPGIFISFLCMPFSGH